MTGARYDLCTPDMLIGWRVVNADFTSHGGYRWPFPGNWAEPDVRGCPPRLGGPCPTFEGDGLCIALTPWGAGSGGICLHTVLVVGYYRADILGRDEDKARVRRALVLDLWDGQALIRAVGDGASLDGANLVRASLYGCYYDEFTGLPRGFDPIAAGMVKR